MPEEFIEVEDVLLQVTQPDSSVVSVSVGRHTIREPGRKEMKTLKATVPDFTGTLYAKLRSGRECKLLARAKGEVAYRTVFAGTITDIDESPYEADSWQVTAHDFWKKLVKHRVTLRQLNVEGAAAVQAILAGSAITGNNVVTPYGETLDLLSLDYREAHSAIHDLMDRLDADAFIDTTGDLHFFPRASVSSGLSVLDDGTGTIKPKWRESDANQVTRIRGFGGKGFSEFHAQLVQGATKTVTDAILVKKRITFPRPEVARIVLKVERVAGSTDALEVAVQNDDGTGTTPSGVDVARVVLDYQNQPAALAEVTLDFPSHVVADTQPWVILRASGATGVKVGVLSGVDDSPYAKAYYRYPIIVEVEAEPAVIAAYGYLDGELKNPQVTTRGEMLALCEAELARRKLPLKTGSFTPTSASWLDAVVGTTVQVTAASIGSTAETWSITAKEHRFNGGGVWYLTVEVAAVVSPQTAEDILKRQADAIEQLQRVLVPTHNEDVTKITKGTSSATAGDAGTMTHPVAAFTWGTSKWTFAEWGG